MQPSIALGVVVSRSSPGSASFSAGSMRSSASSYRRASGRNAVNADLDRQAPSAADWRPWLSLISTARRRERLQRHASSRDMLLGNRRIVSK